MKKIKNGQYNPKTLYPEILQHCVKGQTAGRRLVVAVCLGREPSVAHKSVMVFCATHGGEEGGGGLGIHATPNGYVSKDARHAHTSTCTRARVTIGKRDTYACSMKFPCACVCMSACAVLQHCMFYNISSYGEHPERFRKEHERFFFFFFCPGNEIGRTAFKISCGL